MRAVSNLILAAMYALVSGCSSPDASQPPQIDEREVTLLNRTGELQRICQAWDQRNRAAPTAETEAGQRAIIAAIRANADPAAEAERAAMSQAWGLIRSYEMGGTRPFGIECAESSSLSQGQPLVRAYRVYSDVSGSCETFGTSGDCNVEARLDRFAVAYNRALVARSDYPYRDICRVSQSARSFATGAAVSRGRHDLGFEQLAEPDKPRDFYEAARRGNIPALEEMLVNDPEVINRLDPYRMTPLDWAIRYGQAETVDWLLDNRSLPDGGECGYLRVPSAFHMALLRGHEDIADRIHSAIPAARRQNRWESDDLFYAAVGGSTTFLQRMLREPHDDVNQVTPRDGLTFDPAAQALLARYQTVN